MIFPHYTVTGEKVKLQIYFGDPARYIQTTNDAAIARWDRTTTEQTASSSLSKSPQVAWLKDPPVSSDAAAMHPFLVKQNIDPQVPQTGQEYEPQIAALNPYAENIDLESFDENFEYLSGSIPDPLEKWNRMMFKFNEKFYFVVYMPVAKKYNAVVPEGVRVAICNFFNNLATPVRFVNDMLQGKVEASAKELGSFLVNSTIGIAGFFEVARKDDPELITPEEDFGQTLAFYGIGHGCYIVWPILGPSSLRDSVGLIGDNFLNPVLYLVPGAAGKVGANSYDSFNRGSLIPVEYDDLNRMTLDPYIVTKDAYYQHREWETGR